MQIKVIETFPRLFILPTQRYFAHYLPNSATKGAVIKIITMRILTYIDIPIECVAIVAL